MSERDEAFEKWTQSGVPVSLHSAFHAHDAEIADLQRQLRERNQDAIEASRKLRFELDNARAELAEFRRQAVLPGAQIDSGFTIESQPDPLHRTMATPTNALTTSYSGAALDAYVQEKVDQLSKVMRQMKDESVLRESEEIAEAHKNLVLQNTAAAFVEWLGCRVAANRAKVNP